VRVFLISLATVGLAVVACSGSDDSDPVRTPTTGEPTQPATSTETPASAIPTVTAATDSGSEAGTPPVPTEGPPTTVVPLDPSGCPIDDQDFCAKAAAVANALASGELDVVVEFSTQQRAECDELPAGFDRQCAEGEVIEGYTVSDSQFHPQILDREEYLDWLAGLPRPDPRGGGRGTPGSFDVIGVSACGTADLQSRSYHLLALATPSTDIASQLEEWVISAEFTHRALDEWLVGVIFADTLASWRVNSYGNAPLTDFACGDVQPWV
jgi:hypothetical protein